MPTQYRDIQVFPGYRVGDDGSVWSLKTGHWRRLKPRPDSKGYLRACLWRGGILHRRRIHHVVLEMFVGPCPLGMQCRHFPDRDRTNNCLNNLAWGTPQQNEADKLAHGTSNTGEANHFAKLTADDVRTVRRLRTAGKSIKEIAAMFSVTAQAVRFVLSGKTWATVTTQ